MQENQQVVFLSDGRDDVQNLQHHLSPQAEHLLDWFHVTMRLTVMNQMAKGLPKTIGEGEDEYSLREPVAQAARKHQMVVPTNKSVLVERMDLRPQGGSVTDRC